MAPIRWNTGNTSPSAPVSRSGSAARDHPGRSRGPFIYYLLAIFDILTVSASLFLNHRIMSIYADSVAANHAWAARMADYAALGRLAANVDAPGNDVVRDP
jgi:hypothetical protein